MSDYEFTMSLRVQHPRIDPTEITRALGIRPQHTWRAGEPRRDPAGVSLEGTHRDSYWVASLMAEPQLAAAHIDVESEMLRAATQLRRSSDFLQSLADQGGAAQIEVSLFAREDFRLELSPDLLLLFGRLGLTVIFDVQPHPKSTDPIVPL